MVNYHYDAYGVLLQTGGTMATTLGALNPLTYRGYVYDHETGLYYLQSRYYNPTIRQFISPDALISTGQGYIGYNLFAYCGNNPANWKDPVGTRPVAYNETGEEAADTHAWSLLYMRKAHIIDLTDTLMIFMNKNVEKLTEYRSNHSYIATAFYFYKNVTDGGNLDIKLQEEWAFKPGMHYFFNGKPLRYDDPGNINFGYVGAVIFPETFLCVGAGANQIRKYGFRFGDITTFYDDPRDNQMIKYGYSLYMEGHS